MRIARNLAPGSRSHAARTALLAVAALLPMTFAPAHAETQGAASDKNLTAQVQKGLPVGLPSLAPLVEHVSSAVVTISAQITGDRTAKSDSGSDDDDSSGLPFDEFLRRFFERRGMPQAGREMVGLGSGFIIGADGYIVTNNHVVGKASKITVILQDNSRHPAKIVGRDEKTDLALIKIEADRKLPFVTWGDSDQTKVGDWVAAVGNPFGLGGTVTAGIVSAVGRNINEGPYDDFLQIDAPINRGNSGGPTFNLAAEVIGVNTAIYSPSGGSVGIGFAVPSNTAREVIGQLKATGHVTRGWLGVAIQGITSSIAKSLGLDADKPQGALVASVTPDSPAARAGLKQGDVIVAAGGRPIRSVHDLPRVVAATRPGHELPLKIMRNGKETELAATIGQMPENPEAMAAKATAPRGGENATSLGMQLASIDPALRREYRIADEVEEGVVVTKVGSGSPAAEIGIEPGDVIQSVDQKPVETPRQAAQALKQAADSGNVLLLINRRGRSQFVGFSVTPGVGSSGSR